MKKPDFFVWEDTYLEIKCMLVPGRLRQMNSGAPLSLTLLQWDSTSHPSHHPYWQDTALAVAPEGHRDCGTAHQPG